MYCHAHAQISCLPEGELDVSLFGGEVRGVHINGTHGHLSLHLSHKQAIQVYEIVRQLLCQFEDEECALSDAAAEDKDEKTVIGSNPP